MDPEDASNVAAGVGIVASTIRGNPKRLLNKVDNVVDNVVDKLKGRTGKQARLKELAKDVRTSKADKGWIKQEQNQISRGTRRNIRNSPGKDLAHKRGKEAAKGNSYKEADLQTRELHKLQHKYDNFGRKNKPVK